jgi:hypothetical protein
MDEKEKHRDPDQLFSDALAQLEVQPSAAVWGGIEKALNQGGRKPAFWWWLSGLLMLLIFAAGSSFYLISKNTTDQTISALAHASAPQKGFAKPGLEHPSSLIARRAMEIPLDTCTELNETAAKIETVSPTDTPPVSGRLTSPESKAGDGATGNPKNGLPKVNAGQMVHKSKPTGTNQAVAQPIGKASAGAVYTASTTKPTSAAISKSKPKQTNSTSGLHTAESPALATNQSHSTTPTKQEASAAPITGTTATNTGVGMPLKPADQTTAANAGSSKPVAGATKPVASVPIKSSAGGTSEVETNSAMHLTKPASGDSLPAKKDQTEAQPMTLTAALKKADSLKSVTTTSSLLVTPATRKDSLNPVTGTDSLKSTAQAASSLPHTPKTDSSKPASASPFLFVLSGYGSPELTMNRVMSNTGVFDVKSEKQNPRVGGGLKFSLCFRDKVVVTLGVAYSQNHQEMSPQLVIISKTQSKPFLFNSTYGDMAVPAATMLSSFNQAAPVPAFHCKYQYNQTVQYIQIPPYPGLPPSCWSLWSLCFCRNQLTVCLQLHRHT